MIYYATDSNARTTTYSIFMFAAVLIQSLLSQLFKFLNTQFLFLDISTLSAFTIFTISMIVYDRYVWNRKIGWIRFSTIPDFTGEWVGYIEERQEFTQQGEVFVKQTEQLIAIQLHINQTFRKISINLKSLAVSPHARPRESDCTTAGVFEQDARRPKLLYTWIRSDLAGSGEFVRKQEGERATLDGHYQSNYPRAGNIRVILKRPGEHWFCGRVTIIHNRDGTPYVGVHIPEGVLLPMLQLMRKFVPNPSYDQFRLNQNTRDNGGFHMTVLEPTEYEVHKSGLDDHVKKTLVWMRFVGLGKQATSDDECYFCVIECDGAQRIRHAVGLGNRDMHATLGFKTGDMHDVPKGTNTLIEKL